MNNTTNNGNEPKIERKILPAPVWLLTFADTAALILTFFVLLFSMMTLREFPNITVTSLLSLSDTTSVDHLPQPVSDRAVEGRPLLRALPADYLTTLIRDKITTIPDLRDVIVTGKERQVLISLPVDTFFNPRDVTLNQRARQVLFELVSVLQPLGNDLSVVGHTDPEEANRLGVLSNWDLSLSRAISVLSEMRSVGYTRKASAVGAGHSRFQDLSPDLSPEERLRQARRVDIVLSDHVGGQ